MHPSLCIPSSILVLLLRSVSKLKLVRRRDSMMTSRILEHLSSRKAQGHHLVRGPKLRELLAPHADCRCPVPLLASDLLLYVRTSTFRYEITIPFCAGGQRAIIIYLIFYTPIFALLLRVCPQTADRHHRRSNETKGKHPACHQSVFEFRILLLLLHKLYVSKISKKSRLLRSRYERAVASARVR